jgi:hypothetical protein
MTNKKVALITGVTGQDGAFLAACRTEFSLDWVSERVPAVLDVGHMCM